MSAFSETAIYYDLLANSARRMERESPFLLEYLARAPKKRVLDIACGTGVHARFLADYGANVTALDLSESMTAHAQQVRAHPAIQYGVCDMSRLDTLPADRGPWDMALCLGNSLSLLPDLESLDRTFAGVGKRIAPGGCFITQLLNYSADANRQPRHRLERAISLESSETIIAAKSLVPEGDRTCLALTVFVLGPHGERTFTDAAILRNWTLDDLSHVAANAGMTLEGAWGGFDGQPFNQADTPDLLTVWRKVGET